MDKMVVHQWDQINNNSNSLNRVKDSNQLKFNYNLLRKEEKKEQ